MALILKPGVAYILLGGIILLTSFFNSFSKLEPKVYSLL